MLAILQENVPAAAKTLHLAFATDPVLLWLFGGEERYLRNAAGSIQSWVKWTVLYGIACATPQFESVTLWKKPDKHDFNFWNLLRSGMLFTPCATDTLIRKRVLLLDELIAKTYKDEIGSDQFWYCWMLGTKPQDQHQGYGTSLIRHMFDLTQQSSLPLCLETATPQNIPVYQKLGYHIFSEKRIPTTDLILYFMCKITP